MILWANHPTSALPVDGLAPAPNMTTAITRWTPALPAWLQPLFGTRSARTERDRQLARRLCTAMDELLALTGVGGVQFYVYDAIVTVYGTVPSYEDLTLVTEHLSAVPGVERITNNLRVQTAPATT